ncbi:MAG: CDP-alcohol phosphatidyltransferase family protein [Sedimentisphaerales bacterium]|nr:CDP-alcohol phosphatidyltransferase family protein [Sedimentisphaerales bacterium]
MENNKGIVRFIPNTLTVGRLVLTAIFLVMVLYAPRIGEEKPSNFLLIAFILFVITGLTDIVDGKLARMYDVTSKFGRILDPLADKFLVCGAFICFAIVGQPKLDNFNITPLTMDVLRWATALIIIARELFVTILRQTAEARGINFAATISGKIKMFLQSFGIGTVMIKWAYVSRTWGDIFTAVAFSLMVILTVISGVRSVQRPRK